MQMVHMYSCTKAISTTLTDRKFGTCGLTKSCNLGTRVISVCLGYTMAANMFMLAMFLAAFSLF